MGVVSRLKKKGIIKDDELEKDKNKREELLKKSQEKLPKASEIRNSLKTSKKTDREEDSDNWFQERNKGKKLKRVQSQNKITSVNDFIGRTIHSIAEDGKKSNSLLKKGSSYVLGAAADTGLFINSAAQSFGQAFPRTWQWTNRLAKDTEKSSSSDKVQEFLMRNYELNDYLNQGSTQYNNINREKQKALDDLVNHGTGLAKLTEEQKNTLKTEIQQIMNKHENISMNNSDANTRGEQLDEISKTIEKYMGLDYYDKTVDKTQDVVNAFEEEKQKNVANTNTKIGKVAVEELAPVLGDSAVSMIPGIGNAVMFASSSQKYYEDATQRGMSKEKSNLFGNLMGVVEVGTNALNIKNLKGIWSSFKTVGKYGTQEVTKEAIKRGASQETVNLISNIRATSFKNLLKETIKGSFENGAQEFATEYIEEGLAEAIDKKGEFDGLFGRALHAFNLGAIAEFLPGIVGGSVNVINGRLKVNNSQLNSFIEDMSNDNLTEQQINIVSEELAKETGNNKQDVKDALMAVAESYKEVRENTKKQIKQATQQTQDIEQLPVANEQNTNSNKLRKIAENEINNSNISNEVKQQMIETLDSMEQITSNDMEAIRESIQQEELANNQETLYNNNESESGVNEGNTKGYTIERGNGIYEESKSTKNNSREYTWDEYNRWEQSIKSIEENDITSKERQSINKAKQEYDKNILLYDENSNDSRYSGGASQNIANKITISRQKAETFGLDNMINHEIIESDIIHNEKANDILSPVIDLIKADKNFKLQKNKFWEGQDSNMPSDNLIAKDILCDRFAEIKTGENLGYNNILSNTTNSTIDMALSNYHKQVYGRELEKSSSFNISDDERIIKELSSTRLQSPKGISSFVDANNNASTSNNSIPQSTKNVKSDSTINNNFMQKIENNTKNNILYSEDIITKNKQENLTQKQTEEKVANILEKPQLKEKESDRKWAIFKAGILDKGIVFEELSQKTKNRELQGKWDYTLTATARGQNAIGNARYEYDSKNKTRKQISKSLEDIRIEVGKNTKNFNKYMYHLLNIDRMTLEERYGTANKPVFSNEITAEVSQRIVNQLEDQYPKFKEMAQDVYDYNNANKQELVRNGVISKELANKLGEMYPHYVPIKRVDAKGNAIKVPLDTNRTGVNAPLARATGGTSDIQPLFETMADRTMQTYRASARNNFGLELMNTLNSQTESITTDVDTIIDEIGSEDTELLKEGKNGNNPTFTVFNNGEKTTFEITKDMYDALKPLSDSSMLSKTSKKLNTISNLRRGVLTEYNPLFSITNAIKDAQDVIVNSQHTAKTFSKFPEAYSQIFQKGYWYNEYMEHGGEQNSYFKDGEFTSDQKVSKAKKALHIPLDMISNVNNVIETAPRLAEYIASRESGRNIETSMLDAARVTTNFKAGGDITKFANRNGFTFLNASVQGMQQQIRNIKEANMKGLKGYALLAGRYTVAGVIPAIINSLVWKDDKDYDELQDYVKDNYYCVAKLGNGKFVRLPKGRVAATLQKIVSNIGEYITEDKKLNLDNFAKDFWEDMLFAIDNLAPNNPIDNNIASPIAQTIKNTSWYGEDIVPKRLQDKPKEEQYDETTDSLSIWIGEKLKASPYKVNYLLDQYLGGVGDVLLPKLTKQAENNVLEDKFTTDSVMKSKYPGEFFIKSDELKVSSNSSKATDEDTLKYKYISGISSDMSNLYKQKREIQNSNTTDKVKKQQLKEVQKQINSIAKEALENVDKVTINKNSATIGTQQYYKDTKGRWKKVTDEDKIEGVSLNTYTDYKTKLEETKQKKIDSGELKENQQLPDSEKIKILLSSNYSQKEKAAIYEKSILSSQDETYPALKKLFTNKGLNINNYLEYKSQKFEANKKDDGTVKGKSVSGTKKKKVYNYINKMDISYTQKLVLLGTQYKLSNTERNTLANYINNSDLSYDEKMTLYGKFKGFKVYKDGTIRY